MHGGVKSSKFIFHIGLHFFLCISQLMTNFNNQYLCSIATNKPDVKHMEISTTKEQSNQVSLSILVKLNCNSSQVLNCFSLSQPPHHPNMSEGERQYIASTETLQRKATFATPNVPTNVHLGLPLTTALQF